MARVNDLHMPAWYIQERAKRAVRGIKGRCLVTWGRARSPSQQQLSRRRGFRKQGWHELQRVLRPQSPGFEFPAHSCLGWEEEARQKWRPKTRSKRVDGTRSAVPCGCASRCASSVWPDPGAASGLCLVSFEIGSDCGKNRVCEHRTLRISPAGRVWARWDLSGRETVCITQPRSHEPHAAA